MENYYKDQLSALSKDSDYPMSVVLSDGQGNRTKQINLNTESIPEVTSFLNSLIQDLRTREIDKRVSELLPLPEVRAFLDDVALDHNHKRDYFFLDEFGMLCSNRAVDLPEILQSEDRETVERLIDDMFSSVEVTDDDVIVTECYGEPVIFNVNPERNCYAIYSNGLDLKIESVEDERHGFLIIEEAMRKVGIYEWIVSISRYGYVDVLSMPDDISKLSDAEISAEIERIENGEDE